MTTFAARLRQIVPPEAVVSPDDTHYDQARVVFNRVHDVHPVAILRSLDPKHVSAALSLAIDEGVPVAVRGGGHHIAGYSTVQDGLVIDFSGFRQVTVDTSSGYAHVQPGVRLGDLDAALTHHGRFVPVGTVSDTGVVGLTLGGGIGWFVAGYGLTCDYLHEAQLLLLDGRVVTVSADSHPKLFTMLRGGGAGAFGVILNMTYRSVPLPAFESGTVKFPLHKACSVLGRLHRWLTPNAPRGVTIAVTFGVDGLELDVCDYSDRRLLQRSLRQAVGGDWSDVLPRHYLDWQAHLDHSFSEPARGYWKSKHYEDLNLDVAALVHAIEAAPGPRASILLEYFNRETLLASAPASAYPLRSSRVGVLFSARWANATEDANYIGWARRSAERLGPGIGSYSNYSAEREITDLFSSYDAELDQLRLEYDPRNILRRNHGRSTGSSS